MGENNNKPIGFTGYLGPYAQVLSTRKNSIWGIPIGSSVLPTRGRPVHLVEGAYRGCLEVPAAPLWGDVAEGRTISGKCVRVGDTRFLRKKMRKGLTK